MLSSKLKKSYFHKKCLKIKSKFSQKIQIKKKQHIFSYSKRSSHHFDYLFHCLTPERPMGHICPMFFPRICYMNITKKTILNSRQFYFLGSFVHITKKNYAIHPFFVSHLAILFNQLQNLWNCGIMRYFDKTKILIKSK